MMRLKEVLESKKGDPVTVLTTATVADAIRAMSERRVGSVMVPYADGSPAGIFTERDVLRLCAEGRTDFANMSIRPCMTCDITTGQPGDTVSETLSTMTAKRFRHMPVVENGKLVGVVSIGDLVKAKLEETAQEAQALREYIHS
ncbi:MAG: CBS domain-containing protein [Candidatus Competibacteraceae bacterium]|uniref:Signal transduction protein containing cAMP-binding and CBS domains n=1 Tax=Candidatus Contendobacter odensis Run_B_J11 TaxID=1400861 RepID=A0A7U7GE85_9GAMM|nr:CBS domain-containing protein [Candidatus Contendobacter odensis]MBK8533859.1 CBS domain-containing protein [Candidatus Competibacteraceae bacterium]MBK8751286.1 CBS domain-containing protein [Candidatus Competibacteraceae bacterium]CDH46229.1 putative Signal transduction protein containing cAMP-binding and CBS domains [Candidatus Contendobacter odensis Run_B_J11]